MNKTVRIGVLALFVGLTAGAVALALKSFGAVKATAVVEIVPYTVTLEETIYKADGTTATGGVYLQAVRSDGSWAHRSSYFSATKQASRRLVYFTSGVQVQIDELSGLKTTSTHASGVPRARDPESGCVNRLVVGQASTAWGTLQGTATVSGHQTNIVDVNGARFWLAPDLGCAALRISMGPADHPWNDQVAIEILTGDPEAALFDIPSYLQEVTELHPPSTLQNSDVPIIKAPFGKH